MRMQRPRGPFESWRASLQCDGARGLALAGLCALLLALQLGGDAARSALEYDRTALLAAGDNTLPLEIFALTVGSVIRPDLYALGTATTAVSLVGVGLFLLVAAIVLRRRTRSEEPREEYGQLATDVPAGAPASRAP